MKRATFGIRYTHLSSAIAAVAIAGVSLAAPAQADEAKSYIFAIDEIKGSSELPSPAVKEIRSRLAAAIEEHERIDGEIPEEAPDPESEPEKFERYMKAKKLRAYQVYMEVTDYRAEVEEQPDNPGHMVTVHMALRFFGEGIPRRTMDFSGDGSATARVPTGRRVRDPDRRHAHETAIRSAVEEAFASAFRELDGPKKR